MSACPECGAAVVSCDELFQGLLALDHSRREPWGPLHGVAVACYLLQHGSRLSRDDRAVHWALVHAYMRGGRAALARTTEHARRRNTHRHGGHPPRDDGRRDAPPSPDGPPSPGAPFPGVPPFPGGPPPRAYAVTIADVAVDGGFPAGGYEDRLRAWAATTVDAWTGRVTG